jgi:predicted membrane protein
MENNNITNRTNDRFWTGLILILVGGVLFADRMGFDFPHWLFSWQMLVILIGLISGIKHRFQNNSWLIMVAIGTFFLADEIIMDWHLKPFFWPLIIIGMGLLFILRPKSRWTGSRRNWRNSEYIKSYPLQSQESNSGEDVIDSTSIFGGVKKVITSKNFKGGEIVCFMGGAEYNLSQADITGPVTIEITQAFGGTKLIVPPHWEIKTESVAIFGGIEDKRPIQPGAFDPNKLLILKGTTIFGGIEIKSY